MVRRGGDDATEFVARYWLTRLREPRGMTRSMSDVRERSSVTVVYEVSPAMWITEEARAGETSSRA